MYTRVCIANISSISAKMTAVNEMVMEKDQDNDMLTVLPLTLSTLVFGETNENSL